MQQTAAWYMATLIPGLCFMPVTASIFSKWQDRGWLVSKTLGLFCAAVFLWIMNSLKIISFSVKGTYMALIFVLALNLIFYMAERRKKTGISFGGKGLSGIEGAQKETKASWQLILAEELIFIALFLLCVWIVGFRPEAYGTEKFMDYGFITSILRSEWMPFEDPWYAGETINYYYGGQYVTAFLIRLSGVSAGYGYNLMRAFITAMSFCLPFAIGRGLMASFLSERKGEKGGRQRKIPVLGGLLSGLAVAFCGNGHYVIYGIILPLYNRLTGTAGDSYWFPSSTRYIGYNPDTADKTIHEFPSYSSVLGDLHAHYINLLFVLTVIALITAWALAKTDKDGISRGEKKLIGAGAGRESLRAALKEALLNPAIILIGLMTGLFRWMNFWDFPIYVVVCGAVILFVQLRVYRKSPLCFLAGTLAQLAEILLLGKAAALPFTLSFDMISSQILPTTKHTAFYQLMVLWGLPAVCVILFFVLIIRDERARCRQEEPGKGPENEGVSGRKNGLQRLGSGFMSLLSHMPVSDLLVLIFGAAALGLVLMPELVYVKDIYGEAYQRSNTMFKLTYQAFVLFGLSMAYSILRFIMEKKKLIRNTGLVLLFLLLLTGGYILQAVNSWFGNVFDSTAHLTTDASSYLQNEFSSDEGAVNWLNEHAQSGEVVLEAQGSSYSECGRVSVSTGLPTVAGWYTHEWLWRGDLDAFLERSEDIKTIYTSSDAEEIRALIKKYHITYLYIGTVERDTYGEISDLLLQSLGSVAYSDGKTTYILDVSDIAFDREGS